MTELYRLFQSKDTFFEPDPSDPPTGFNLKIQGKIR